jgi:hypothetical protein
VVVEPRKQTVGQGGAAQPAASRSLAGILKAPAFRVGALMGLVFLLAWTFGIGSSTDEVSRDILVEDERSVASLAVLFLKAPLAMIAGGLALDFISRRLLGKGGAQ